MSKKIQLAVLLGGCLTLVCLLPGCKDKPYSSDNPFYGRGYGTGHGSGCYQRMEDMDKHLGLTDEQMSKIRDIDSKYRVKYYENRGDFSKIEDIRKEHHSSIKEVLNDDQKEKYGKIYEDIWYRCLGPHGGHHGRGHYGHGFGMGYASGCYRRVDVMKSRLDLSDEQIAEIVKIDSGYREKYYENRGDFDKIEDLRRAHKEAILNLLNEKQKEKFKDYYSERWGYCLRMQKKHHRGGK